MTTPAVSVVLVSALWASCGRQAATARPALAPSIAAELPVVADVEAPFRWQIRELHTELHVGDDQVVPDVASAIVGQWATAALADLPMVQGIGLGQAVTRTQLAGVALTVGWQRVDAKYQPVAMTAPEAAALVVHIQAQAETPGTRPTAAEIASRTSQVLLPMPPGASAAWLQSRLQQALGQAAADVLAELWVRRASDAEVVRWMQQGDTWQVAAGAREVGERRLLDQRKRLHKLAHDSRDQVAVVAVTALGRLGGDDSVPVLVKAAQGRHPQTIAAALDALAMLQTPQARRALCALSQDLPPAVQKRVAALCAQMQADVTPVQAPTSER